MRFPEIAGYQYEDLLGEDPFGWTFVAAHEGGKRRVIKVFKAQATCDRFIQPYFKAFRNSAAPLAGVAPVYEFILQGTDTLSACVLPFYGWKGRESDQWQVSSLKRLMALLSREQAAEIVRELAVRLSEIHEVGLFHGGLRPSGIFLTGDSKGGQKVRIADFGQIFMGGLQHLEAGELLFYTSPEQIASGDFTSDRGKRWDVYSFGVIAFQLLTGHLPRLDQLRQQCERHPEWLNSAPAIAFGELTTVSEHFLNQLEVEKSVEWPTEPADDSERSLRTLIGQCLRFDPLNRPASMVEVSRLISGEDKLDRTAEAENSSTLAGRDATPVPVEAGAFAAAGFEEIAPREAVPLLQFLKTIRENPTARWQAIAVVAMIAVLPLSCFAVLSTLKLREMEARQADEVSELAAELQTNVNKAATAYIRQNKSLQKNSEQLKAELDEAEDSTSRLLGEAKLARQILRQTQENGDQFFRLVLENRDSDVEEFRAGRAQALVEGRKHYERLVEAYGDAPDFIVSAANALFYLGRIYKEMGEFGKALASFGEAERRYSALLEDSSTSNPEFVKNIAISKSALGQLAITSGQYSVARHYFTESSRFWTEARALSPDEAMTAALSIHGNSLDIVECEIAMDRLDAALDAALSIGVQLTGLQKQSPQDHRVIGAIARSFALSGRVLEARQDLETARKAYQQSSDLYAQAVKLDAAVDAYQLGLGNSLARVGLLSNDFEKLESAAEVLGSVIAANPYESAYLKTLADIYGALARNQRDGGQLKNAIVLEQKAIGILKPIIDGNKAIASDVNFSYSQRLSHLAELLGDSGKFDESRIPLKEAITVLEKLSESDVKVAEYQRSLARARGMVGFACVKAGDNTEAKKHLELARTEWQNFIVSNPEDTDAAQAVKWTSEQLMRLP
jgi:eukaryotic-like serine/threonine-protein kinase